MTYPQRYAQFETESGFMEAADDGAPAVDEMLVTNGTLVDDGVAAGVILIAKDNGPAEVEEVAVEDVAVSAGKEIIADEIVVGDSVEAVATDGVWEL